MAKSSKAPKMIWTDTKQVMRLVEILRENVVLKSRAPWVVLCIVTLIGGLFFLIREPWPLDEFQKEIKSHASEWEREIQFKGERIFAQEKWQLCLERHSCSAYGYLISARIADSNNEQIFRSLVRCMWRDVPGCLGLVVMKVTELEPHRLYVPLYRSFQKYCPDVPKPFCSFLATFALEEDNLQEAEYFMTMVPRAKHPYDEIVMARIAMAKNDPGTALSALANSFQLGWEYFRGFNLMDELHHKRYESLRQNAQYLQLEKDCRKEQDSYVEKLQSAFGSYGKNKHLKK
ncbi:MAG: hypothetical protein HYV97_19820 [Bdellovibrio sp.]|nr:hypothetical protein [Bdellovibrio sp.]